MDRLLETINNHKYIKQHLNSLNQDKKIKGSRVLLFAGPQFNRQLASIVKKENIIDFNQFNKDTDSNEAKFVEIKLKKTNTEEDSFPIIWFKNVEKTAKSTWEKVLLPIFDSQQNNDLYHGEVDLSNYILISTTSTSDTAQLSDALLSRLDWINVESAQTKRFFWDKYYWSLLTTSLLFNIITLFYFVMPKCNTHGIKWKCNC